MGNAPQGRTKESLDVNRREPPELELDINFDDFEFENIVMEGGGTKASAYPGAIQVLEETGIWPRIRRLAGTSAGAMAAALLSIGCSSKELEDLLKENLSTVFIDRDWGYLSFLPNLHKYFGWNASTKFDIWMGEIIERKTGNPDITFIEVYNKYDRELCIVVTNVNQMKPEFCHPKTTPHMPIRKAVRMSTALPVYFQPVPFKRYEQEEYFVDGGVVCNYPIKCFDGWWLSMKPEDAFLERMPQLSEINDVYDDGARFGTYNPHTIGMLVYTGQEYEVFKKRLEARQGVLGAECIPDTTLSTHYKNTRTAYVKIVAAHAALAAARKQLRKALKSRNVEVTDVIRKQNLKEVLEEEGLTDEMMKTLFEGETDLVEILKSLGNDACFGDLLRRVDQRGLDLQTDYQIKNGVTKIENVTHFGQMIFDTMLFNSQRQNVKDDDYERTVGINTHHVGTIDFALEDDDKTFLIKQGRRAMKAFLLERWRATQANTTAN